MRVAFELRNEPGVYAYFFNPETVDWETHRRWFSRSLENPQRRLLIVENLRNALGVLRLDLNEDQAEVSVSLHPACQGQGFGTRALSLGTRWVRRHLPGVRRLIARIRSDNLASERAFERAGFHEHHRVYVAELGEASTS
jgi:RimJ/RimL family protein N-acetyltransferase